MTDQVARNVRVSGGVQGAVYRDAARAEAERLGITGWVRNRADGKVELHIEGWPAAVEQLVVWCHEGPNGADGDSVEVTEATCEGSDSFDVRLPLSQQDVDAEWGVPPLPLTLWPQWWARLMSLWLLGMWIVLMVQIAISAPAVGLGTVPIAMVAALPLWPIVRFAWVHVRLEPEGVRVFNPLHTHTLRWDEIAVVDAVDQTAGIGGYARIVTTGGSKIIIAATNVGIRGDPTSALRMAVPLWQVIDRETVRRQTG